MAEDQEFGQTLQEMIKAKAQWFNEVRVQELLSEYRLLYTCVRNLYELLSKKTLIVPDPYRLDKRISQIVVPETSQFADSEASKVLGSRFSDYETMLDFICTYYRFSTETLTIPEIKKLTEFNASFDWKNFSTNSTQPNARALANILNQAKNNAPGVTVSMINDCVSKNEASSENITIMLNEMGVFQRELFKAELRKDMFEHPEFNKEKAFSSPEAEMAEIKRLYVKVMGKKTFYTDLVNEIIEEDQGANKEKLQQTVLKRLEIKNKTVQTQKKKAGPTTKNIIMECVYALGAMAPTLLLLNQKLSENFNLIFAKKRNFFTFFGSVLRSLFRMKPKEKIVNVTVIEAKTNTTRKEKVNVSEFMEQMTYKARIYNGIGAKGPELAKIENSTEDAILMFVNKQISEAQSLYTIINALDTYFKSEVDITIRPKIKGVQIELSALRNSIINVNKKRGEYVSRREEYEQMRKLGLNDV